VEQLAHEMLNQAFRQASLRHHPDRGGDPETMRRVYAARELILKAIHKTHAMR
jgi:curved DNA-binding protein CbpA